MKTKVIDIGKVITLLIILASVNAHAMRDANNQGRWEKPTVNNLPDKEVPGFLVNLGPTGARAILTENTFIIKYIFKDSPAANKLKLDDVIVGIFGKPFGKHTFGGTPFGYEGPIMDLGEAIERAEGSYGKLVLNVQRGGEKIEVAIELEPIGTFSATFPFGCKKSEIIRSKALKYLVEHPDALSVWQSHAKMAVSLALLTSDDPKQIAAGKAIAMRWTGKPGDGTWSWDLAHQLITLSEYHQLTKDPAVLPTMKYLVEALQKSQYSGYIWTAADKDKLEDKKLAAARQLYDGGFGHQPYVQGGSLGYGPMQYPTILAVIAWQEAGRCGVNGNPECIKRALDFIHRGTNAGGYVAYGGEFTLNSGIIDPVAWKKSTGGEDYVGRAGCSIIGHLLSPEYPESKDYLDLNKKYLSKAYKSMPDGHADSNLGIIWGIMGAAASGDDKVLRKILDYHKAYFNMMRCFDGSFVLLPGRDYADDGYYMASRYHPTATMALALGLNNPKLLIQGVQISFPGVNPKALKGNLDVAYKAIVKKNYAEALAALNGAKSEDATAADAMSAFIEARSQQALTTLEELERVGDIARLKMEYEKFRTQFGLSSGFKEKMGHYEEGFRQDAWRLEIRLFENLNTLVDMLRRNKTDAYIGDLERFAEKHQESLYGHWALEIAKEYKASGAVKIPMTVISDHSQALPAHNSMVEQSGVIKPLQPSSGVSASAKPVKTSLKPGEISQEILNEYQNRFIRKLDTLIANGAKLDVWLEFGSKPERFGLRKVSEAGLIIQQGESQLPVPWSNISLTHRAILAKSIAKEDDPESLEIAAILNQAAGKKDEAESLAAVVALKDSQAARKLKDILGIH